LETTHAPAWHDDAPFPHGVPLSYCCVVQLLAGGKLAVGRPIHANAGSGFAPSERAPTLTGPIGQVQLCELPNALVRLVRSWPSWVLTVTVNAAPRVNIGRCNVVR